MSKTNRDLLIDMLTWLAAGERPYAEVMEAWRTSCPRLTIWEDAVEGRLVEHVRNGRAHLVRISPAGLAFLAQRDTRSAPELELWGA